MRARLVILLLAVLAVSVSSRVAVADEEGYEIRNSVMAQEEEAETETGGGEGTEAETGAGQGETQQAPAEPGPPWTFQMARIGGVLVLLLLLGIGWWYYRLVIRRQRGEI
jgi:cobalamin biosynthesis Mg chelatase CobN